MFSLTPLKKILVSIFRDDFSTKKIIFYHVSDEKDIKVVALFVMLMA
jgi:hypothetical protein